MWIKVLKAVVKAAKVFGKAAKGAASGSVKLGKTAYKFVKMANSFNKEFPRLSSFINGLAVGASKNEIIDFIKTQTISDALKEKAISMVNEADSLSENEAVKVTSELFTYATASSGGITPQHPEWWFQKGKKSHYSNARNNGYDVFALLEDVVHHSFVVDLGNIREGLIPDSMHDAIWQCYQSYYKRLPINAPLDKASLIRKISVILYSAMWAMGSAIHLKTSLDSDEARLLDSKSAADFCKPISYYDVLTSPANLIGVVNPNDPAQLHNELTDKLFETSGVLPVNKLVNTSPIKYGKRFNWRSPSTLTWELQANPTQSNYNVKSVRPNCPAISNDMWTRMIAKLRNLPISQDMYEYLWYLFDGTWIDKSDEDKYEMYSFTPAPLVTAQLMNKPTVSGESTTNPGAYYPTSQMLAMIDDGTTFDIDSSSGNFKSICKVCDDVEQIINDDKAIAALFAACGLNATGDTKAVRKPMAWYGTIGDDMRRDIRHETLKFKTCDDSFYQAMVNARYISAAYYDQTITNGNASATYKVLLPTVASVWGQFTPEHPTKEMREGFFALPVFFGKDKLLEDAKQISDVQSKINVIPELLSCERGELASACKFTTPTLSLWVGPKRVAYRDAATDKTYAVCASPCITEFNYDLRQDSADGEWLCSNDLFNKRGPATRASFIPMRLEVTSSDRWDDKYEPTSSSAGQSAIYLYSTIRGRTSAFEKRLVTEISSCVNYQYANMCMSIEVLKEWQKQLDATTLQFDIG